MSTSTEVLRPFRNRMAAAGFQYSRGAYLLPLTEDALGFVGFNHARRGYPPDAASLVPTIGVQYRQVQDFLVRAELFPTGSTAPNIKTQLQGLISPSEYVDLVVSLSAPDSYDMVVGLIESRALPFLRDHTTLESGLDAARERLGEYLEFSTPVFEFLAGDQSKSVRSLEDLVASVQGQSGVWPDHVRRVAGNLIELMRE